jgi:hypothetical protein
MRTKKCFSVSLFLVLFSFYAISPLSYTFSDNDIVEKNCIPDSAPSFAKNVRIFFWELICFQLVSEGDSAQPASAERILIKKARALVNKNSLYPLSSSGDALITESPFQPAVYASGEILSEADSKEPRKGIFFLYSGLSPPSA